MPDFNQAAPQRDFDVIPAGTIATLQFENKARRRRGGRLVAPL